MGAEYTYICMADSNSDSEFVCGVCNQINEHLGEKVSEYFDLTNSVVGGTVVVGQVRKHSHAVDEVFADLLRKFDVVMLSVNFGVPTIVFDYDRQA